VVSAALVAVCAAASVAAQQPTRPQPLPSNYHIITPGKYKRDQQLACGDPNGNKPSCNAKCDKRCPNQCIVLCPGCKTFCSTYRSFACFFFTNNRSLVVASIH
jgi:hypothetical protein